MGRDYIWVDWFRELAKKIQEGERSDFIENAKMVRWKDDQTQERMFEFGDENIDPFSFFYTLAYKFRLPDLG